MDLTIMVTGFPVPLSTKNTTDPSLWTTSDAPLEHNDLMTATASLLALTTAVIPREWWSNAELKPGEWTSTTLVFKCKREAVSSQTTVLSCLMERTGAADWFVLRESTRGQLRSFVTTLDTIIWWVTTPLKILAAAASSTVIR